MWTSREIWLRALRLNDNMEIKISNEKKARSSNIEFLRIIAMLMIIASHYVSVGIMHTHFGEPYMNWAHGSFFNRLFTSFFTAGGDVGVGVFFIITGFFLCESQKRRCINGIVCPVIYYAIVGILLNSGLSMILGESISPVNILKLGVCPITGYNWWFATSYIILILLSPVLNDVIHCFSSKRMLAMLVALWVVWYCAGYALQLNLWGIERGIFFYLVGAFFKFKITNNNKISHIILIFIFALSWTMYWGLTYYIGKSVGGLDVPLIMEKNSVVNIMKMTRAVVCAPICSISLFGIFLRIDMKNSKLINYIASTTFGIYLIHEVPINRELIWERIFRCDYYYTTTKYVCLHLVLTVVCIFVIGFILDILRKKYFENKMNSIYFWLLADDNKNK